MRAFRHAQCDEVVERGIYHGEACLIFSLKGGIWNFTDPYHLINESKVRLNEDRLKKPTTL